MSDVVLSIGNLEFYKKVLTLPVLRENITNFLVNASPFRLGTMTSHGTLLCRIDNNTGGNNTGSNTAGSKHFDF